MTNLIIEYKKLARLRLSILNLACETRPFGSRKLRAPKPATNRTGKRVERRRPRAKL